MSKVKYQSYKPSKTIWLDQIPEHWQETDLRMLFSDNKAKNLGLVEKNLLSLSYGKLKRKDIDNATGLVPASFEGYQIIEEGYIVLRFTDLQNDKKSLRVGYVNEKGIITNAYIGLAPKTDLDSKYYYYLLHYLDKFKYYYNLGGGVRQSLSYKDFGRETILVPSEIEQTTIANFLDYKTEKINRFITKKKQLIELLNEQKAAIINQAVTKGINSNVPMKDSGIEWLGEIPEHWEVKRLKYLGKITNGFAFKSHWFKEKGTKVLKITNIQPMRINWEERSFVDDAYYDELESFRLIKNDLVFALTRPIIKAGIKAAFIDSDEKILINQRNAVFRLKDEAVSIKWIFYVLIDKSFERRFEREIDFTNQQPNISSKDIENIEFPLPKLVEQQQIVKHIETETQKINKTISTIEKEITLVEEYKTALIAEAVTGKIDVRDFKLPTEETPLAMVAEEAANYNKENN